MLPRNGKPVKNPERCLEVRFTSPAGDDGSIWALGWYVFVWNYNTKVKTQRSYKAILVRFRRRIDAEIARQSLLLHGLVTLKKLRRESPLNVLRIMCEDLQW